ncbi:unnamed protein product [Symbiodinium sp. CCMP2456]|nr:unnamed protein product [Symbiodinium sp. CCMP2456]
MTNGKFDCSGLAQEWDSSEPLRAGLRAGGPFLTGSLGDFSVSRCVKNTEALVPLLARSHACNHQRPEVERLREQISTLLGLCQRSGSESEVDDWAWEIRKMLTFMKRKCQRQEELVDSIRQKYNEDEPASEDEVLSWEHAGLEVHENGANDEPVIPVPGPPVPVWLAPLPTGASTAPAEPVVPREAVVPGEPVLPKEAVFPREAEVPSSVPSPTSVCATPSPHHAKCGD